MNVELEDIVDDLTNASGLSEDDARLVKMLGDRAFVSHPTDKGNASWLTRAPLLERIQTLEAIREPSAIFATVLSTEDDLALRDIVTEMERRVGVQLDGRDYAAAAATLRTLMRIDVIDNVHVTRMLHGVKDLVHARARDVERAAIEAVMQERFDDAEPTCLGSTRSAARCSGRCRRASTSRRWRASCARSSRCSGGGAKSSGACRSSSSGWRASRPTCAPSTRRRSR